MRLYTYTVDGASPGPGVLVVAANSSHEADILATKHLVAMNGKRAERQQPPVVLTGGRTSSPCTLPGVVYAYDGER